MSVFSSLFSRIAISSDRKFTAAAIDNGVIKCLSYTASENNDGTFSVKTKLSIDSQEINFILNEKLITKVAFVFEIVFHKCIYNDADNWTWNENEGYQVISGKQKPNVIIYSNESALNSTDEGFNYINGFTKKNDIGMGYQKPIVIIATTKANLRERAFKKIISGLEPLSTEA